eukprot:3232771-Pleurochrysis_carterae.AAC.2
MTTVNTGPAQQTLQKSPRSVDGGSDNAGGDMAAPSPLISIFISGRCPGRPFENNLIISCERGSISFDLLTSEAVVFRQGRDAESVGGGGNAWSDVGTPALGHALIAAMRAGGDLRGACAGGIATSRTCDGPSKTSDVNSAAELKIRLSDLATFEDGVMVQRVTDAVHASGARGGAWVEVDASRP